jgi:hypothetical protein
VNSLNANTVISLLTVMGFILLIGAIVLWMVRSNKQQKKERAEMAAMLGFHPAANTDYALLKDRLAVINPRYVKNDQELREVFLHRLPEGDLYLYDLWDTGGDSSSVVHSRALAMVVPEKHFPRFSITSRLVMPGKFAGLANKVITWAMARDMKVIDFPESPEFNTRFIVAGENELPLRELFNSTILDQLKGYEGVFLAGGGDTLMFSQQFEKSTAQKDINILSSRINKAVDIMRLFL